MTCIVGVASGDVAFLGADSASIANWDLTIRADEKVFHNGPMVMGFTDSWRLGQLLRHALVVPPQGAREPVERYMATTFVDAVRSCLKDGGWSRTNNGQEEAGCFLVGYRGELFTVYDDYQVARQVAPFHAIGSGAAYALGSLHSSERSRRGPRARIIEALGAAYRFSAGVRPPFVVRQARSRP